MQGFTKFGFSRALLATGTAMAAILGSSAYAQSAPPASPQSAPEQTSTVDDIVVTARRRSESLARVPVAVAAISAESLTTQNITTQADLQTATPGLIVRSTQGSSQFNYAVRGQSVDAFSTSQPGVLTYVNEFQTTALSAGSFYDLAGVQVLKGPQGTLFGRNTTGGAVLYATAKPEFDEVSGSVRGRLGDFNLRQVEGAVNLPLSDTLALRLAGSVERRDGFVRNLITNRDMNNVDRNSVRASLRWKPTDAFESTTVVEYNESQGDGDALTIYSAYAPGSVGPDGRPLSTLGPTFYSSILDSLAGPGAYAALLAANPGTTQGGLLEAAALQRARGTRFASINGPTGLDASSYYIINTSTYDLGPDTQIKNIIGYSNNENITLIDEDGSAFPFYQRLETTNESKGWSEELNISGKAYAGNLDYIAGVYYSYEKRLSGQDFTYFDLGPVANPILGPVFGALSLPISNRLFGETETESIGAYAQASYKLDAFVPGLGVTGGIRYTQETNDFTALSGFAPVFPGPVDEDVEASKPSWILGVDYQATPDLFFYANYRGSWRGGGFNYSAPPINALATAGGNKFDPETIEDVELGMKFRGEVGGVPVRFNVAAYQSWVDDVQRVAYVTNPTFGPSAVTVNAPGAEYKGAEIDGDFQPTAWLRIGGAYSYTDASYTGPKSLTIFSTFLEFSTFADIAENSGSAFVELNAPVGQNGSTVKFRADGYAQSSSYFSNFGETGAPGTEIPSYALLNLRLSIDNLFGRDIEAAVFAKNATDEEYYVGGIGLGTLAGYNLAVPGTPRIVGVELGMKF
ncbi:TonB-dependent receptor [Brevundimonas sp.]|uniref:TonB-dependent receptor n=1 Tax=Brevundimonas sp. TaxID=1871086 RepID=UPI001A1C4797|nr:TonB-dependent receptor [Brevundimonas sp.]MBJ7483897.1 TonB-dependent receptor plug domain-containing protein [Brevundimonas sp.]